MAHSDAGRELERLVSMHPDTVAAINILEDPDSFDAGEIKSALASVLAALTSGGRELGDAFWDSPAGQLVAAAQWYLYRHEAIMPTEAGRLFFEAEIAAGKLTDNAAKVRIEKMIAAGKLAVYRRPDTAFIRRRKEHQKTRGARYLRRSEVVKKS